MRTQYGDWGSISCHYFYNITEKPAVTRVVTYEYWLDNDRANLKTGTVEGSQMTLPIDLSGFNLNGEFHCFNMRIGDNIDGWGSIYRKIFYRKQHTYDRTVTGYRHQLNDMDLGFVDLPGGLTDSHMFSVDIPNDLKLNTSYSDTLRFNGNIVSVEGNDSIHYSVQLKSAMGLSAPRIWDFVLQHDFSTTAVDMAVNSSHEFVMPKKGEFVAVRFTASGAPLYFRANEHVSLDIYRNGNKIREFSAEETAGMVSAELEAGEHFGILRVEADSVAGNFTFHLMDTPNAVPAPVIGFEDGSITITCSRADAEIYYTIDGSDPTNESNRYEAPFELNHNATVKAIAMVSGSDINPSEIVTYVVDSYKVATPTGTFDAAARLLTLACDTEGADIQYAFEAEGEWYQYTEPISITRNLTVYARATRDGYNDSDITEIRITELADNVPAPEISFADGKVTITCANGDAEIHYTVDGSQPTAESPLYSGPFTVDRNCTVRAFALIPGLDIEPSDIETYVVDSYKVATPWGTFDAAARLLTLVCETEGAEIMYTFDRDGEWMPYTAPIAIEENGTVYAMATMDGWNDSDVAEITVSELKCASVSISYNGRYISMETAEPDAVILYTTDGSEPIDGNEYTGAFDIEGIRTVRAVAVKDGYMDSDIAEYTVDRYADELHAETAAEGLLASAFDWDGTDLSNRVDTYRVEGRLNDADYAFLRSMNELRHLDIENVSDAHIPEYAFLNTRLISISLPADITECGDSILSVTPYLSSVVWNSKTMNVGDGLTRGLSNPNALLYVPSEVSVSGPYAINIVRDGEADEVTLRDGYPYYAARDFRAGSVSLSREFLQPTGIDGCSGWETIVLPFEPTGITHAVNGPAVPFAAWNGAASVEKPFWLYRATSTGWSAARSIEPCVPYILSMPNSDDYMESYNLSGRVTFSATNVDLGPETSLAYAESWINGLQLEGTFMAAEEEGLLSLNVGSTADGLQPGSTFVADGTTVPFGAYVRGASGRRAIPLFGGSNGVDLQVLVDAGLAIEMPSPGVLSITSGRERRIAVTTATGVTVRELHLRPGETVTLEGLTRDLYIVGGVKVMVR